jgi:hypothetical protein
MRTHILRHGVAAAVKWSSVKLRKGRATIAAIATRMSKMLLASAENFLNDSVWRSSSFQSPKSGLFGVWKASRSRFWSRNAFESESPALGERGFLRWAFEGLGTSQICPTGRKLVHKKMAEATGREGDALAPALQRDRSRMG